VQLKVNGVPLVASPSEFKVTILDLDDADSIRSYSRRDVKPG
jgi:hypothetical protein